MPVISIGGSAACRAWLSMCRENACNVFLRAVRGIRTRDARSNGEWDSTVTTLRSDGIDHGTASPCSSSELARPNMYPCPSAAPKAIACSRW
jgi:hypothetical protein